MKNYFIHMLPAERPKSMSEFIKSIDGSRVKVRLKREKVRYNGDKYPRDRLYFVLRGTANDGRRLVYNDGAFTSVTYHRKGEEREIEYAKICIEGRKRRISEDIRKIHPGADIVSKNGYLA